MLSFLQETMLMDKIEFCQELVALIILFALYTMCYKPYLSNAVPTMSENKKTDCGKLALNFPQNFVKVLLNII